MRVALGHHQGSVAQRFSYLRERRAIHGEVARRRMAQIVEPAMLFADETSRFPDSPPRHIQLGRHAVPGTFEDPILSCRIALELLLKYSLGGADGRYVTRIAVLRGLEPQPPGVEVDIFPGEHAQIRISSAGSKR